MPSNLVTTPEHSTAYEASHVLKDTGGVLLALTGYNSGSAQFIQLHDATSRPSNAAVPVHVQAVAGTANFSLILPTGLYFATGIVVTNSSTGPTLTVGGSDCFFTGQVA